MRTYHFVASINNTNVADKIAKQVWYTLTTLQDAVMAEVLEPNLQSGYFGGKGSVFF